MTSKIPARRLRPLVILFVAALLGPAARAQSGAGEARLLVDRELRTQMIELLMVNGDSIKYRDEQGRLRHAGVAGFVAMLPAAGTKDRAEQAIRSAERESPGYIELTDGQRFPGELTPTGGEQDVVAWSHPRFGDVRFTLEQVARVVVDRAVLESVPAEQAEAIRGGAPVEDALLLANGDRLDGFILSLGDPIEIETDGSVVSISQDRVAGVRLANPDAGLTGMVVWLDDGAVAVVASLDAEARRGADLRLEAGPAAETPLESLRAIAFSAGRLRPLDSLELLGQSPIERRRLLSPIGPAPDAPEGVPAPLNAPDMLMPGPMSVRWRLPEGARRFGAIAELPLDALPWADCELVVEIDGREKMRIRLDQQRTRHELSVPIDSAETGSELVLRLEPGEYGPVNDRVILRRPILLVD